MKENNIKIYNKHCNENSRDDKKNADIYIKVLIHIFLIIIN